MKFKSLIYATLAGATLLGYQSCSPDDYSIGDQDLSSTDVMEGIGFTVEHDANDENHIICTSLLPSNYNIIWQSDLGQSIGNSRELKYAFPGNHWVLMGVMTRGGIVFSDTVKIDITKNNFSYVEDEVWRLLSGGVGESKTWIYDDGSYGFSGGPLSYGEPSKALYYGSDFGHNWTPSGADNPCEDPNMWESTMTFDLIDGANYSFTNSSAKTTATGTYNVDSKSFLLNIADAPLMHPTSWNDRLGNWGKDLQIISIDENHLQVGYVRVPGPWGGEWNEVFNYVSKSFADNFAQALKPVKLNEGWLDTVQPPTTKQINLQFVEYTYYDSQLQEIKKDGGYQSDIDLSTIVLNLDRNDMSYAITLDDNDVASGKYSVSTKGVFSFSNGLGKTAINKNGAFFMADAKNGLQVMSFEVDSYTGFLSTLKLGCAEYDALGNFIDYIVYTAEPIISGAVVKYQGVLTVQSTGFEKATESEPVFISEDGNYTFEIPTLETDIYCLYLDIEKMYKKNPNCDVIIKDIKINGTSITIDDKVIPRSDKDGDKSTARRYIVNPWNEVHIKDEYQAPYKNATSLSVTVEVKLKTDLPFTDDERNPKE